MTRAGKFFRGLTVGDVVHRTVLVIPQGMCVERAAHLLLKRRLGAAPVADSSGRCVGILSVADILRWNLDGGPFGPNHFETTACVWCDWQVVDVKSTGRDNVGHCMIRDPLLVTSDTLLVEIAKILIDPHRRPVVVIDQKRRPLGVLTSKDVLVALTFATRQPEENSAWSSDGDTIGSNNERELAEFAHAR